MSEADRLYNDGPRDPNSSALLQMFVASIGLLVVYAVGYAGLTLLAGGGPDTGSLLSVWLPPLLMGAAVSILVCIPMKFMKNKYVIPGAMAFLILYYAVLVIAFKTSKIAADPGLDIYIISLYALPCILPGNLIAWLGYWKLRV